VALVDLLLLLPLAAVVTLALLGVKALTELVAVVAGPSRARRRLGETTALLPPLAVVGLGAAALAAVRGTTVVEGELIALGLALALLYVVGLEVLVAARRARWARAAGTATPAQPALASRRPRAAA
jgi:hypothetical protein